MGLGVPRPAAPPPPQLPLQPQLYAPAPGPYGPPPAQFPPGPPPKPRRPFPRWLLPAALGFCIVVAGVAWWAWPTSSTPATHIAAGTVQATVLSADDVSRITGTTVVSASTVSQPPPPLSADQPGCTVAVGPTTQSVYGNAWTAFLSVTYQDSARKGTFTVNQVAAVFPSADRASAAFKTLSDGLKDCQTAVVTDRGGRATQWHYALGTQDPASLGWTATQDAGNGWACHHQARLTGSSLLQSSVCEAGNGEPAAIAVANRFVAQVKG
jgi:hypothetical protein